MLTEFVWPIILVVTAALIVLVGVVVVWRTHKERRSGFPLSDERTSRITEKAAYYSWYAGTFYMIAVLLTLVVGKEFFNFPDMGEMPALNSSILVFSVSFLVFRWYFNRKGDS